MKYIKNKLFALLTIAAVLAVIAGCEKYTDNLILPPEQAHFSNQSSGKLIVSNNTASPFKIAVGITTVSDKERVVNIKVYSPTGAVAGTHYSLNKTTANFAPGKVSDTLVVTALAISQYMANRIDTLVFVVEKGGDKYSGAPSDYNDTFKLRIGPCYESEISSALATLEGSYTNTQDNFNGAGYVYTSNIVSTKYTTATTGNITIKNLLDLGTPTDATFSMDWTNPATPRIVTGDQNLGGDAGLVFGATYNGWNYLIRQSGSGNFNFCSETITLSFNLSIVSPTTGQILSAGSVVVVMKKT